MFFDRLKALCDDQNISPYKVCEAIGLNRAAVAKWKKGSTPNGATAAKLANYFGVTTDYLLGGDVASGHVQEVELFKGVGGIQIGEKYRNLTKENSPSEYELTEGEKQLIELFRLIPEEQQRHFLEMGRAFANSLRKG